MSSTDEMIKMQEDAEHMHHDEFIKKYGVEFQYVWREHNDAR